MVCTGTVGMHKPHGIAIDNVTGNIYVVESIGSRIWKYTADGSFLTKWGSFGSENGNFTYPNGIAVNSSGYAYVADTDNNRIQVFTKDGIYVKKWGSRGSGNGNFNYPAGIAVNSSGFVYVADTGNNRIQIFTPKRGLCESMGIIRDG